MFFNGTLKGLISRLYLKFTRTIGQGEKMQVLIRTADLVSANEALEISEHREMFETRIRQQLSKIPIEVAFDWTLIETDPGNAFLFFDRKGYPMSLPPRLAGLAGLVEQAAADAVSRVILVMEHSPARAQRWRARAETYRTIAECTRSSTGRDTYLALAASCLQFAERLADFGAVDSPEADAPPEPDEDEPRNAA